MPVKPPQSFLLTPIFVCNGKCFECKEKKCLDF